MMFDFFFLPLDVSNFLVLSSKITIDGDIFLSFGIFGCHCSANLFLDYCSSCALSNSAEGGDV